MDIVQRLRLHYGSSAVADDAADEILKLRAALTGIAVMDIYTRHGEDPPHEVMRAAAKKALEKHP